MRIGINANFFAKPSTGIGVVTREFMHALAETPEGREHEWIWYFEGLVPVGAWPKNWQFQKVSTWWQRDDTLHRYLWESVALPRAVKRDQCDIFFSLYQSATVLPAKIRHVMLVHDLIPKHFPEYLHTLYQRLHYRAIERGMRAAQYIITPSQTTKRDLELLLSIPQERSIIAPLGSAERFRETVPVDTRDAILKRYMLTPGYLYHGGGLELRKNTALLLRAYAQLTKAADRERLPPLVISGVVHAESNPLATPVRALITELGLKDQVRLLGWVPDEDLPVLYQSAKMFIYPSRYEGFGLPVLEAFASGTPVITTPSGSLAELVQDAALTVSPDDASGLAQAIHSLLTDPELGTALSVKGRRRVADYSWSRFVSLVINRLLQ